MHHPDFQKLEGSWRGLHYLVFESETSTMLKIRVLNVSKKDLLKDLERAAEFDQTALFKKIYEEEYGTFGGAPFGALIGDYEFGNHPAGHVASREDLGRRRRGARALHLGGLARAVRLGDLHRADRGRATSRKIFDRTEYAKWRSFRDSEDSRYVGLTLPHILMRLPYGQDTVPVEAFNFEEDVDGKDHKKYLWGNAAYAFGTRLTDAFALYHWSAAIRGVEGGGLVQGLPAHTFQTDEGDVALKCPTEIAITDRREKELSDLGFIPLVHCKNTDYAAFFGGQSAQKAKIYDTDSANANARLSTQLPYIFAVSRFAHYLKAIMRDKIGSFASPRRRRVLPQQLDLELRHARRHGVARGQGAVPASRGPHRGRGSARQARRLQGGRLPEAALPARRAHGLPAAGGRAAAAVEEVRDGTGRGRRKLAGPGTRPGSAPWRGSTRRSGSTCRFSTGSSISSRSRQRSLPPRARRPSARSSRPSSGTSSGS